ncbi:MAG: VWA domain-containing protein [Verrucomicrobia bacterium]|nr:VWA domain-containing protein [Verrucomicrobiota bacterium]
MKFSDPIALHALWLVPVVVAFFWFAFRQRRRGLERFAAPHLWPTVAPAALSDRLWVWRAVLVTVAVALLAFALAGPRWGFRWEEVKRKGIDIFVAIDVSKSMLAQDVRPSRLEQAKLAVRDLLREAVGDRVGLIAFAGTAFAPCPLTLDHAAVQMVLDDLAPESIPLGGTDIAGAMKEAMRGFEKAADRNCAIIIITDGENTADSNPLSVAKTAATLGIKVFTIGVGTTGGELIPAVGEGGEREFMKDKEGRAVQTRLDEATLQQIALTTQGYYVHATAGNFGLDTIYKQGILSMEPKDFETQLVRQYEERFQWPLGAALLLLLIEALLRERSKEASGFEFRFTKRLRASSLVVGLLLLNSSLLAADGTEPPPKLFNFGNDAYRKQQFDDAAKAYAQALVAKGPALQERAFYNLGNAYYRLGEPLEATAPERAQEMFKQSVTSYESALALDPKDEDAKFNKELVEVRLKQLQQQQQQQRQQQQQKQQQKQQQQQQQAGQQKQDQQQQQQQQAQQQQQQQQQKQPEQQKQPGEPQDQKRDMSEMEAKLMLDAEREEEKHWKDVLSARKLGQREPEKNW